MTKQKITEADGLHKEWYEAAKKEDMAGLLGFMEDLLEEYEHDYGTIVHAIAACAIAAASAANNSSVGGITRVQASYVMWCFITNWMSIEDGAPLRLIQYGDMLYPQNANKFEKTITQETWDYLQDEAKKYLRERPERNVEIHPDVIAHWQSIAAGVVPFGYTVAQ